MHDGVQSEASSLIHLHVIFANACILAIEQYVLPIKAWMLQLRLVTMDVALLDLRCTFHLGQIEANSK